MPVTTELFDLSGKVAIITGSSRGIGRSIVRELAAHGAKVVISSRKPADYDRWIGGMNRLHQRLAGEAYLPFLVANRAALESGADRVRIDAHGLAYEGAPFKYQSRCLEELRRGYAALSDEARQQVDPLLEAHDCLAPLQG